MVLLSLRGVHHSTLFGVVPLWCPSHITRKKTQALPVLGDDPFKVQGAELQLFFNTCRGNTM